jgi:hypothetical protein
LDILPVEDNWKIWTKSYKIVFKKLLDGIRNLINQTRMSDLEEGRTQGNGNPVHLGPLLPV